MGVMYGGIVKIHSSTFTSEPQSPSDIYFISRRTGQKVGGVRLHEQERLLGGSRGLRNNVDTWDKRGP